MYVNQILDTKLFFVEYGNVNRSEIEIPVIDLHVCYFRQSKLQVIEFRKTSSIYLIN